MSAPARPRPRPRPRAKPSGSAESATLIAAAAADSVTKTIITINKETLTVSGKTVQGPSPAAEGVVQVPDEDDDFDIFARRRNAVKDRQSSTDLGKEPSYGRPICTSGPLSATDVSEDEDGHRLKRKRSTSHQASRVRLGGRIEEESEGSTEGDSDGHGRFGDRASGMRRDRQATKPVSRARSISLTPPPQIAPVIPSPSSRPPLPIHTLLDDDDDFQPYPADVWKPTSTGIELDAKDDDTAVENAELAALIARARAKYAAEHYHASSANSAGLREGSNSRSGAFPSAEDSAGYFTDRGIMLQLTVTMRQDPIRAKAISARALKIYEKARVFTIGSKCSLDPIYEKLAEVLDKEKEDIILTYRGERIWSTNFTPERLKIYTDENLEGYEKEAWEKTQQYNDAERIRKLREAQSELAEIAAERQALGARDSGLGGGMHPGEDSDDEIQVTAVINPRAVSVSAGGNAPASTGDGNNEEDAEDTSAILNLTLRGKEGDIKAKAKLTTKMASLVAHYRKQKKIEMEMDIELDGEILQGHSTVADADLDDGDMLSVVPAR
ncbi:hypothetical protein NliqN6_3345 [Naganishia liquefaciens]|uniref:Rad60/SUMO-like domain-containing protein n=1 Tax=Naganishia liquefaciens TaxID=104408 RepID=A0A8H3TU53_9TREE|nr:hypothetical protein NliqN6_3345 [Naganishia liquefaciens]